MCTITRRKRSSVLAEEEILTDRDKDGDDDMNEDGQLEKINVKHWFYLLFYSEQYLFWCKIV